MVCEGAPTVRATQRATGAEWTAEVSRISRWVVEVLTGTRYPNWLGSARIRRFGTERPTAPTLSGSPSAWAAHPLGAARLLWIRKSVSVRALRTRRTRRAQLET